MIAYQVQAWYSLTVGAGACPENYSTYIIRFSQIYRNVRHSLQIIITLNSDTDQGFLKCEVISGNSVANIDTDAITAFQFQPN